MPLSPGRRVVRRIKLLSIWVVIFGLAGVIIASAVFMRALTEARTHLGGIRDKIDLPEAKPTIILAADGQELYRTSPEMRIPLVLANLNEETRKRIVNAVIAAEDKRFFSHKGIDPIGLTRAVWDLRKSHRGSGGSTITMQLCKVLYNGNERSIDRKIRDLALAYAIEEDMPKEKILETYLNTVFFGKGAIGFKAAAKVYFNKDLSELTIGECAMLARCIRTPSLENPVTNYDKAIENRNVVLTTMLDEQLISQSEYDEARAEQPKVNRRPPRASATIKAAPYAVMHALRDIEREAPELDLREGGYTIETTIDLDLQEKAEEIVDRIVKENISKKVTSAAFVLCDRDGKILVEIGGVGWKKTKFNRITQAKLQPGSSFKAIVYSTGFKEGTIHLGDQLSNAAIKIKDRSLPGGFWKPRNSNKNESGSSVSVERAFAESWNLPAIHLSMDVGLDKVVQTAKDVFGIDGITAVPSLALGSKEVTPLQMLSAYSVFMMKGDRVEPRILARVKGPNGELVKSFETKTYNGVLSPDVVQSMDSLMERVVSNGTGRGAGVVPNARGKTGTTNDTKDAWFCGYTDGLVAIGWVGNERYGENSARLHVGRRRAFGSRPGKRSR